MTISGTIKVAKNFLYSLSRRKTLIIAAYAAAATAVLAGSLSYISYPKITGSIFAAGIFYGLVSFIIATCLGFIAIWARRNPESFFLRSVVVLGFIIIGSIVVSEPHSRTYDEILKAQSRVSERIVAAGGVEIESTKVVDGSRWWFTGFLCFRPCMEVREDFLIPIEPGQEDSLINQTILDPEGYKVPLPPAGYPASIPLDCDISRVDAICTYGRNKGKTSIWITLDPVVKYAAQKPSRPIAPKVWRTISVNVSSTNVEVPVEK